MNLKEFTDFLDKKIEENERYVRITFYELRIEQNLSEQETKDFLKLAKNRLINFGYEVYMREEDCNLQNNNVILDDNELLIGIRKM